jgi:hypothetical protein
MLLELKELSENRVRELTGTADFRLNEYRADWVLNSSSARDFNSGATHVRT